MTQTTKKEDRESLQEVCVAIGDCLATLIAYANLDSVSNQHRIVDAFHRLGGRIYDWVEPEEEDL
jgi:hypothetical protein